VKTSLQEGPGGVASDENHGSHLGVGNNRPKLCSDGSQGAEAKPVGKRGVGKLGLVLRQVVVVAAGRGS
jgi:hypothetical protein